MALAQDPPVSESQRKAMFAAKAGNSTLGIPQSVGAEFANADPGGHLPAKARDAGGMEFLSTLKNFFRAAMSWAAEEEGEGEHEEDGQDDVSPHAAGVCFSTPTGHALFVKRSDKGDHAGEWAFPAGMAEANETPEECASREAAEEVYPGCSLDGLVQMDARDGFHTFRKEVGRRFVPILNDEATEYMWAPLSSPPTPLHPGVKETLRAINEAEGSAGTAGTGGYAEKEAQDEVDEDEWTPEAREAAAEARRRNAGGGGKSHWASSVSRPGPDPGLFSPRGNVSAAANKRFMKNADPTLGAELEASHKRHQESIQEHPRDKLLRNAKQLRDLAARGMSTKKFIKQAEALEKQAKELPEGQDAESEHEEGKLTETTREKIGTPGSEKREDMPEGVFLGPNKTYPVKERRDGEWKYTRNLLLAAARRARMQKEPSIAKKADEIRAREFGGEGEDQLVTAPNSGVMPRGRRAHDAMALDRAMPPKERYYDADGRLHVDSANISKATVNPYYGEEINGVMKDEPGWKMLEPGKKYQLLRHPDALKKAVDSFNGLPLLFTHKPTSAEDHPEALTVGSTGNEASFEHPYLKNSLWIWPKYASDAIEDGERKQLSCGYAYKVDMKPGTFEGQAYDGVMRDIVGNHVALVHVGRAGPDVSIDEDPDSAIWLMIEQALIGFQAAA
jgi:hypothetical protein